MGVFRKLEAAQEYAEQLALRDASDGGWEPDLSYKRNVITSYTRYGLSYYEIDEFVLDDTYYLYD